MKLETYFLGKYEINDLGFNTIFLNKFTLEALLLLVPAYSLTKEYKSMFSPLLPSFFFFSMETFLLLHSHVTSYHIYFAKLTPPFAIHRNTIEIDIHMHFAPFLTICNYTRHDLHKASDGLILSNIEYFLSLSCY